jgi:hypothetical protein
LRIIFEVDEKLRRASVRTARRIRDGPAPVRLAHRIVGDVVVAPFQLNLRIALDAPLHDEIGHVAKEPVLIVEVFLDQVIESIHTFRGPIAMNF